MATSVSVILSLHISDHPESPALPRWRRQSEQRKSSFVVSTQWSLLRFVCGTYEYQLAQGIGRRSRISGGYNNFYSNEYSTTDNMNSANQNIAPIYETPMDGNDLHLIWPWPWYKLGEKHQRWLRATRVGIDKLYQVRLGKGSYAEAASRLVHIATVLLRPPSGHRPYNRHAHHARIPQIVFHLTQT